MRGVCGEAEGVSVRLLHGDARAVLAALPDTSVQCCVTSPLTRESAA